MTTEITSVYTGKGKEKPREHGKGTRDEGLHVLVKHTFIFGGLRYTQEKTKQIHKTNNAISNKF